MIPVLLCALITLSLADNDLDTLYPELEHSRTIYVTGELWFMQSFFSFCCFFCFCRTEMPSGVPRSLSFVRDTHSAVSAASSPVYQRLLLLLWPGDNAAMWGDY